MSWQIDHPLATVLRAASVGQFPPADGAAVVVPPDAWGACGVWSFTGHAVLLTPLAEATVAMFEPDGYGAASDPRLLVHLAGPTGTIGSHDVLLVRSGVGGGSELEFRSDLEAHTRVVRARHHRRDVRVLGDARGFVTMGAGVVGRTELSIELTGATPGRGAGRELIEQALRDVPLGELVFAQVAAGNALSLRAFLAAGFVPIASQVIIEPSHPVGSAT